MSDPPRRTRRSGYDEPRGKSIPILPLAIVVILAGLALGALAARFFGHSNEKPAATISQTQSATAAPNTNTSAPNVLTPAPRPATPKRIGPLARTPAPPSASPPAAHALLHRIALVTPTPVTLAKPAPRRSAVPVSTSAPSVKTIAPRNPTAPPRSIAPPAPASASDPAANLARSYLQALMRGDRRSAAADLGEAPETGSLDEAEFLDSSSRITSVHTLTNSDGTYKVEAEVAASKGTFFVTMQVAHVSGGYVITDHHAIRIQ